MVNRPQDELCSGEGNKIRGGKKKKKEERVKGKIRGNSV